jgi:hypothetical protein
MADRVIAVESEEEEEHLERTIDIDESPDHEQQDLFGGGSDAPEKNERTEAEEYTERVQNRINKLTYDREEAKRNENTAIDMGRSLASENEVLKRRLVGMDSGYVSEAEERIKSQKEQAKLAYRSAIEAEDVDSQVAAQEIIAKLTIDEERVKAAKRRVESQSAQEAVAPQYVPPQQSAQPPPPTIEPIVPVEPSEKAIGWAAKNAWFGKDERKTKFVMQEHEHMVRQEGFDPDSDTYYDELEFRVGRAFPDANAESTGAPQQNGRKSPRAVAPVGSSQRPASKKTSVKLNEREIAMAKKLCPSTNSKDIEDFIKSYAREKAALEAQREV